MLKDPIAWLVIRVIGLLLLGQTLLVLVDGVAQALELASVSGRGAQRAEAVLRLHAGISVLKAVLFGALAYYFLCRGRTVHRWLIHEPR